MSETVTLPDHEERMGAARRVAQWQLGDPSWADMLVQAYCDPDAAHERMDEEGAPE